MPARYRAEQVGSLLRPAELLQARAAFAESKISLEELRAKEDQAIAQALEKQRQIGIDIFSDGEMRRGSWLTDMADAVEGFVPQRVELDWKGPGGGREGSTALAAGAKLRKARKLTGHELPFLKRLARNSLTVALHICRGNSRSRWYTEGGYDLIAEKLFSRLNVDTFLLEYDTDRSGGFEPLRLVPQGKNVVLGLVTTKEPRLESQDDLRRRIDEAARYVPLENLALSPQCGFASVALGNLLTPDDQWRKLE